MTLAVIDGACLCGASVARDSGRATARGNTGRMGLGATEAARRQLGNALLARVAGPEGPARRDRIRDAEGERWFAPDRPIRAVHGDASMFVGGIRALLLQSLHPRAMPGAPPRPAFARAPGGRLRRRSHFLAVTAFGAAGDA